MDKMGKGKKTAFSKKKIIWGLQCLGKMTNIIIVLALIHNEC